VLEEGDLSLCAQVSPVFKAHNRVNGIDYRKKSKLLYMFLAFSKNLVDNLQITRTAEAND